MHPNRSSVEEMADLALERFHDLLGAVERETDLVDDNIRFESGNSFPEVAPCFVSLTVHSNRLNGIPRSMRLVRISVATADVDVLIASLDKARNQEGPHMAAAANHDHSFHRSSPRRGLEN